MFSVYSQIRFIFSGASHLGRNTDNQQLSVTLKLL